MYYDFQAIFWMSIICAVYYKLTLNTKIICCMLWWKYVRQHNSELAISWQHTLPRADPVCSQGCSSWQNYAPQILHRLHSLHCNFLEKHDLSTPGCCPGVSGCCFADKLLCSVHTEQLPSVYLCAERALICWASVNEKKFRLTSRKLLVAEWAEIPPLDWT